MLAIWSAFSKTILNIWKFMVHILLKPGLENFEHYLRACAAVAAKSLQSCPTLWEPMNCCPPGSSVRGILQTRILEWTAIPFSRGSSQPRDWIWVSCIAGRFFTIWATREDSLTKGNFLKCWPWGQKKGHFLIFQLLRNFQKLMCLLMPLALIN